MHHKISVVLVTFLLCSVSFFPSVYSNNCRNNDTVTPIAKRLNFYEALSLYKKLIKSDVCQQFEILKRYNILPQNACLPRYGGPYLVSCIVLGFGYPLCHIPCIMAMLAFEGEIFEYINPITFLTIYLLVLIISATIEIINILIPPPLPKINIGFQLLSLWARYYINIISPTQRYKDSGVTAGFYLFALGFVGWTIYIPLKIITDQWIVIDGFSFPIPLSMIIVIGSALHLKYMA